MLLFLHLLPRQLRPLSQQYAMFCLHEEETRAHCLNKMMRFTLQHIMTGMFSFWTYFNIMQNMKCNFEGYTNSKSPRRKRCLIFAGGQDITQQTARNLFITFFHLWPWESSEGEHFWHRRLKLTCASVCNDPWFLLQWHQTLSINRNSDLIPGGYVEINNIV